MNKYEIMFIVRTDIDEKTGKDTVAAFEKVLKGMKAKIVSSKDMGQKKLAYPIKKEVNGFYYVIDFSAKQDLISELNRRFRIDEAILRHMIIRLDEE